MQQLDVKNLGRKEVSRIQIKLPPRLTAHEVIPNSQSDKVDNFNNQDSFELVYPQLPPQGAFRIILKTPGDGIRRDEVSVSHSKGLAQYALASGSSLASTINWTGVIFLVIYLYCTVLSITNHALDNWESRANYDSEVVLRRNKPFYAGLDKWSKIRAIALENIAKKESYADSDVQTQSNYKWLDRDKPEFLSDGEWDKFQILAVTTLLSQIEAFRNRAFMSEQFLSLLKIKRPMQCSPQKWDEVHARIEKAFLSTKLSNPYADFHAMLFEVKPDEVSNIAWDDYRRSLNNKYFQSLAEEMVFSLRPLEDLSRKDVTPLNPDMADKLRKQAYKRELLNLPSLIYESDAEAFLKSSRPAWMSNDDYSNYTAKAERTLKSAKESTINRIVFSNLMRLLSGSPPDDKELEQLEPEWRTRLKKLDEDLRIGKEKLATEADRVSRENRELEMQKPKILKQLEILNKLFSDPTSIDRVESYDNPFAAGNLETLKKISILMRSSEPAKK